MQGVWRLLKIIRFRFLVTNPSLHPFYTKLICNLFISGLIQLLDLMHTLHTRALSIFKPPNVEGQRVPLNDSSMQPIVGEVCLTYYFAVV